MRVGQRVMTIGRTIEYDCVPPPIGSVGTICEPMDEDGDYEVMVDGWPWSAEDPAWFIPASFLVPIDEQPVAAEKSCALSGAEKHP